MKHLRRWYRRSDLAYFLEKYQSYRRVGNPYGYWPMQAAWLALRWASCRYAWAARIKQKFGNWR